MLYMIVVLDKCYRSTCVFVDVMFDIKVCYPSVVVDSEEMLAFHLCYMRLFCQRSYFLTCVFVGVVFDLCQCSVW